MPEAQCFFEAQRKGRDLRRALYQQELCRPLGFPVVRRKTNCSIRSSSSVKTPGCGPSYRRTPPNFLHHYDFKPTCPKPPPVTMQCNYIPLCPAMPMMCSDAVRSFPPAMPAETILSGFRNAHSGPGFETIPLDNFGTCRPPCDYISNFQIVHTMVSPCGPELTLYTVPPARLCPRAPIPGPPAVTLGFLDCTATASSVPDPVVIRELASDDCQQMGLCGYRRREESERRVPEKVYTSLPGLGSDQDDPPKPWRDPCGGRIYYRLSDNDFIQQWGSPS